LEPITEENVLGAHVWATCSTTPCMCICYCAE